MSKSTIKIGGAAGYWGDSAMATPQLLSVGDLDYIVYDYLAEITMSILARAKAKNPQAGFATDFIDFVLKPNLGAIAKSGVKLIANAGGVNPQSCAVAARALIKEAGLDLKVGVITGDDLMVQIDDLGENAPQEMFTAAPFPPLDKITSANAYLGAFPIATALARGADIVITGRCVDSAVTLGACIHEFGWPRDDWNALANGSLAGHILECGPQATGGNYTDWRDVKNIAEIGYPIAEIAADGSFTVSKPEGTGGLVTVGSVSEQMVYEIGDPSAYILPDVTCDFSNVVIEQQSLDRVSVKGAKGAAAPNDYKTCITYADGFRTGLTLTLYGSEAADKAQAFADAAIARARRTLRILNAPEFTETDIEIIGGGSQTGDFTLRESAQEVVVKIAAKHATPLEGGVLLKEVSGLGLATPPGLSGFQGGRAKPTPVMRLFSCLTPKSKITVTVDVDGDERRFEEPASVEAPACFGETVAPPEAPSLTSDDLVSVPLIKLAWARSGDKGDKANIGVIARQPHYLPYIWAALDEDVIATRFAHFIDGGAANVTRFHMPGAHAMNILIDRVLGGGGVASLRNDPQGKGYAQILLTQPIPVPATISKDLK